MMAKRFGWLLAGAALAVPALLWAQVQANYSDKTRNFVLSGFATFGFKTAPDGGMTFSGKGKPAVGVSVSQKLRVEALEWTGSATKSAAGTNELTEAAWTGQVHVVADRDTGMVDITVPRARYKNEGRTFELEGGLTVVQTLKDGTMTLKAASGSISLYDTKPEDAPSSIRSAQVSGSVRVVLRTQAKEKPAPTVLTADAAKLVYDAQARTLTLTGGVKLTGDDSVMSGDAVGSSAVVTLDAAGKPIGIEMVGEPGVSHITERKKGGR